MEARSDTHLTTALRNALVSQHHRTLSGTDSELCINTPYL